MKHPSKEQEQIINSPVGYSLVNAGAGSGKTFTITKRIEHLIVNEGFYPFQIMAVTFTNKAANEMKERIISNLRGKGINFKNPPLIGTFHGIALRYLKTYYKRIGYDDNFSVLDADDATSIQKEIFKSFSEQRSEIFDETNLEFVDFAEFVEYIKNKGYNIDKLKEFVSKNSKSLTEERRHSQLIQMYEYYQRKLIHELNAMDFGDLLLNFYEILEIPDIYEEITDEIKYLFVDEYQDTNRIQNLIVRKLSEKSKNLCVVGDDYQSIYAFRGAEIENILEFQQLFKGTTVYNLGTNYRSTPEIVKLGDALIKNNTRQLHKDLSAYNNSGSLPELNNFTTSFLEADYIASVIKENGKNDYKDTAILIRNAYLSQGIENALLKLNIPYRVIGGMSFFSRREIKDIKAILDILVNDKAFRAFGTAAGFLIKGLGAKSIDKVVDFLLLEDQGISWLLSNHTVLKEKKILTGKAYSLFKDFLSLIQVLKTETHNQDLVSLVEKVLEITNFYELLEEKAKSKEEIENRTQNINQFLSLVGERQAMADNNLTLSELLSDITIDDTNSTEEQDEENAVNIITLHRSKGLEFKHVFIPAMEEGIMPSSKATTLKDIEEERRLLYVGITRAKENLHLSYSDNRFVFGKTSYQRASMFVDEIKNSGLTKQKRR